MAILFGVTIAGFAFSFPGGFSITLLQVAAFVGAILIYVLFAWVIPGQVGFLGIQLELPICLIAYAVALRYPPAIAGIMGESRLSPRRGFS